MFDINKIGQYISFLRKNNNMTQGQLAEKLGVSHQAVSNWERGEAMPDIALLTRLAKALNTTSDRILLSGENTGEPSSSNPPITIEKQDETCIKPVEFNASAAAEETEKADIKQHQAPAVESDCENAFKEKKSKIGELENAIRTLEEKMRGISSQSVIDKLQELIDEVREQIDGLQEEIDEIQDEIDEEQVNPDELKGLEEIFKLDSLKGLEGLAGLKSLADMSNVFKGMNSMQQLKVNVNVSPACSSKDEDTDGANWQRIVSFAPFASRETLDKLISKLDENTDFTKILQLAPFIDNQTIEKMILKAFDNGEAADGRIVIGLAPFASGATLDLLISRLTEKADFKSILRLAPFLNSSTLERLVLDAFKGGDNPDWDIIVSLAPFITNGTLDMLIAKLEEKADFSKIISLAPFLGTATIERLVHGAFNNGEAVNWNLVTALAPFLTGDTLDMLVSKIDGKAGFNKIMQLAPFLSKATIDRLINEKL